MIWFVQSDSSQQKQMLFQQEQRGIDKDRGYRNLTEAKQIDISQFNKRGIGDNQTKHKFNRRIRRRLKQKRKRITINPKISISADYQIQREQLELQNFLHKCGGSPSNQRLDELFCVKQQSNSYIQVESNQYQSNDQNAATGDSQQNQSPNQ